MISYNLKCKNGHAFDGWFRGSADFDRQVETNMLECPVCGDTTIVKALMAPNVSTTRDKAKAASEVHQAMMVANATAEAQKAADASGAEAGAGSEPASSEPAPAKSVPETPSVPLAAMPSLKDAPPPVKAYVDAVRKLRAHVEKTAEDVGAKFVDEARKMHHGEADERPIRGHATVEEAAELGEEGIEVFAIPVLPEEQN
ncbi:MAG: DUF1178 family protein [Pseudomonadota bacterium]